MSDWQECKLGDLIEHQKGFAFKSSSYTTHGRYIVRVSNFTDRSVDMTDCNYIELQNYDDYSDYVLKADDAVIATVGSWPNNPDSIVGKVILVPLEADGSLLNQNAVRLRVTHQMDQRFLFHLLKSNDFQYYIVNTAQGSANQASITLKDIFSYQFLLPPLPEQRAIAAVLSSLDDKIDLLNRQNKTLEGLTETLWRKIFIIDADPNWKTGRLGDVCEVQNGYAFESSSYQTYQPGFLEVLKMGHIQPGGGLRSNPKRDFVPMDVKLKRWILNKGDIVMAMTDMKDNVVILGNPALIDKDQTYVQNQRVARVTVKDKSKLQNCYILYLQMKDEQFIAELQSRANSGVQVNLTTEAIKACEILTPPYDNQVEFSRMAVELFNKFDLNINQIRTISTLRDGLLPKLMSGAVRVKV